MSDITRQIQERLAKLTGAAQVLSGTPASFAKRFTNNVSGRPPGHYYVFNLTSGPVALEHIEELHPSVTDPARKIENLMPEAELRAIDALLAEVERRASLPAT